MLLHRPGCEYLDRMVENLSDMLKSYGFHVNTTFDGTDVSAHGGIASYLQRNIKLCDYVIVFLTKNKGLFTFYCILLMLYLHQISQRFRLLQGRNVE